MEPCYICPKCNGASGLAVYNSVCGACVTWVGEATLPAYFTDGKLAYDRSGPDYDTNAGAFGEDVPGRINSVVRAW